MIKKISQKQIKWKRGILKAFLIIVGILLIVVLAIAGYAFSILKKVNRGDFDENAVYVYDENIYRPETAPYVNQRPETDWNMEAAEGIDLMKYQNTENGYWNLLFIGVDDRINEPLGNGGDYRADVIIICSINARTKHVKLVSVYRDTVMRMYGNGNFIKVNDGVYNQKNGSIEEIISMINMNLDLKIQDAVVVNWAAVASIVNELGGIELDITQEEINQGVITGYLTKVVESTGIPTIGQFVSPGLQWCDGPRVVAYCRNRMTTGSDFNRTERQREVIEKLLDRAKDVDLKTLVNTVNVVFDNMYTTLSLDEMLTLAADIGNYTIGETMGYPSENITLEYAGGLTSIYGLHNVVIPVTFAENVKALHTFLYGDDSYQPSSQVEMIETNMETLLQK